MPHSFENTLVYECSLELIKMITFAAQSIPASQEGPGECGLDAELRNGALRIPATIARGYGLRTRHDLYTALEKANHEIVELDQRILLARGMEYFDECTVDALLHLTDRLGRLINDMMHTLQQRPRAARPPKPGPRGRRRG